MLVQLDMEAINQEVEAEKWSQLDPKAQERKKFEEWQDKLWEDVKAVWRGQGRPYEFLAPLIKKKQKDKEEYRKAYWNMKFNSPSIEWSTPEEAKWLIKGGGYDDIGRKNKLRKKKGLPLVEKDDVFSLLH